MAFRKVKKKRRGRKVKKGEEKEKKSIKRVKKRKNAESWGIPRDIDVLMRLALKIIFAAGLMRPQV